MRASLQLHLLAPFILKRVLNPNLFVEIIRRAFAIGLAVVTIRPIVGLFFATSRLIGFTPYQFFGAAFWTGFVLHLVAAEAWIRNTRPSQKYPSTTTFHAGYNHPVA